MNVWKEILENQSMSGIWLFTGNLCQGSKIKNKIFSRLRNPLYESSRERKHFCYWEHIKPEHDVHPKLSAKIWKDRRKFDPFI